MGAAPKLELVTITAAELRELVRSEIRGVVEELVARKAEPPSEWITADEAAAIIGVQRSYLRKLRVPVHGSRARPRYRRDEVEAFVARRR